MKDRFAATIMAAVTALAGLMAPEGVISDGNAPYVCMGADLTEEETQSVMKMFSVEEEQLTEDTSVLLTSEEEDRYAGAGDASLSDGRCRISCRVSAGGPGSGIAVDILNVSAYTPAMYVNALATCGIQDVEVVIASPEECTGTAGIAAAMKACAKKNGHALDHVAITAGTRELVLQGKIGKAVCSEDKAAAFMALVKRIALEEKLTEPAGLRALCRDMASRLGMDMDAQTLAETVRLLGDIAAIRPDLKTLLLQSAPVYELAWKYTPDLSAYGIYPGEDGGILTRFGAFFTDSAQESAI